MISIQGVSIQKTENYTSFLISTLSDELKSSIRERLAAVCHGVANVESGSEMYCYKSTLTEFLKRYTSKSDDQKKGMLGELLLHILIAEYFNEYRVNSPFFNMEERSVKKGFDLVLNKTGTADIWLAESKSGALHANKNSTQTAMDLINTAQNDLYNRLNGDSFSLWQNAIIGARSAISEKRDDRDAVIAVLQKYGTAAYKNEISSASANVILVGTVFNNVLDPIDVTKVKEKQSQISSSSKFKNVYIIAIQKNTYTAIYEFLEEESRL